MKLFKKLNQTGFAHVVALAVVVIAVAAVGTAVLIESHAATGCAANTYSYGSSGTCVKYIQTLLNWDASSPHLTVDGAFGSYTKSSVIFRQKTEFQDNGSYYPAITADGIVGSQTWKKICTIAKWTGITQIGGTAAKNAYNYSGCSSVV